MLFSQSSRCLYNRSPLIEVICQLRFPAIPAIDEGEPAEYREAVARDFPRYNLRQEAPGPASAGPAQRPAANHSFVSADGLWKLNLTREFVSLSTMRYHRWEDFAFRLDKPLAHFIQIYQSADVERIGLRYVNAVSRRALGLTGLLWDDLIQTPYLGVLGEPDVNEARVLRSSVDTELLLPDGTRAKLHAGPGLLNGGKVDSEVKFILDGDFSLSGGLNAQQVPEGLLTLHDNAGDLFRAAITKTLHEALDPSPLGF